MPKTAYPSKRDETPATSARQTLERNIALYYARALFGNLAFPRALFVIYLLEQGASHVEVGAFQAAFFLTAVAMEVPTGFIADRVSRRLSVVLGYGCHVFYAIAMLAGGSFSVFVLAFMIGGLGKALVSGADDALVYDSMAAFRCSGSYVKAYTRASAIGSVALGAAILAGGYLRVLSWDWVFLADAVAMALAMLCAWLSREVRPCAKGDLTVAAPEAASPGTIRGGPVIAFLSSFSGRLIGLFMLAYAVYEAGMSPYFIFGQSTFDSYGFGSEQIGMLFFTSQMLSAFAYLAARCMIAWLPTKVLVCWVVLVSVPLLAMHTVAPAWGAVILFLVLNFPPEILYTAAHVYIQDRIPAQMRATVLSLFSFVQSIAIALAFLAVGSAFDHLPAAMALATTAVFVAASIPMFLLYFAASRKEPT